MNFLKFLCLFLILSIYEWLSLIINIFGFCINKITGWCSWSRPAAVQIVFLNQFANANVRARTQSRRKISKKIRRPVVVDLSSSGVNIYEYVEEVQQPELQMEVWKPPKAEMYHDELEDDMTGFNEATAIMEEDDKIEFNNVTAMIEEEKLKLADMDEAMVEPYQLNANAIINTREIMFNKVPAIMQYEEPRISITEQHVNMLEPKPLPQPQVLLAANELDINMKPEMLNKVPAIMHNEEPPIINIPEDANQLETKPMPLPQPQVLPEKQKKPLPGQIKKRIVTPRKMNNKLNVAENQHGVQIKPRWR